MALKIVVKSKSFRIRCIWVLILAPMLTGQKKEKKETSGKLFKFFNPQFHCY